MTKNEEVKMLVLLAILLSGIVTCLSATYYKPEFFPIGLTGLNYTGSGTPYGGQGWDWQWSTTNPKGEDSLIYSLGVNCIGSQDAYPSYLVNLKPTHPDSSDHPSENNYLHKVCVPLDSVYIITAGLWVDSFICHGAAGYTDTIQDDNCQTKTHAMYPWESRCDTLDKYDPDLPLSFLNYDSTKCSDDSVFAGNVHKRYSKLVTKDEKSSQLFRTWEEGAFGPDEFSKNPSPECEGDDAWNDMMDEAVEDLETHLYLNSEHLDYIWGWNILSEGPATYRKAEDATPWPGVWGAADRVLTGEGASHDGIRGAEGNTHHMVVVKAATHPLYRGDYNIFQYVPDIDVWVAYFHTWCRAYNNYGSQMIFDHLLYYSDKSSESWKKKGHHYTAIYMQKYGKTNLAYPEQRRRWMPGLCLEWKIDTTDLTRAYTRRPCPPEIRCAVYLCFSRGAKGVLFHPWLMNYDDTPLLNPKAIDVPADSFTTFPEDDTYWLGLRDQVGYPFGYDGSPYDTTHKLNKASSGTTYWHQHNDDYTYWYLADTLIPEIKTISGVLMQLDWVNGYSLNSTDPNWQSPCPHYYIEDVWGVEYADIGFFDHPYEPIGVEYFMLVNREGIADMTNRSVSVALDAGHWPDADSLLLTDIADREHPRTLTREGDRYVFTQVFEPGEGKLYRVAPAQEPPITYLPEGGAR